MICIIHSFFNPVSILLFIHPYHLSIHPCQSIIHHPSILSLLLIVSTKFNDFLMLRFRATPYMPNRMMTKYIFSCSLILAIVTSVAKIFKLVHRDLKYSLSTCLSIHSSLSFSILCSAIFFLSILSIYSCIHSSSIIGVSPRVRKILQLLRLRQINNGVFVKINKATYNMLKLVEPYIAWG